MHIKIILLVVLTGSMLSTSAQEAKQEQPQKGCSCSFSSINQLGALSGSHEGRPLLQSINGIRYKTWFAGAGIGLDAYYRVGVPIFFDIRKDLLNKSVTPFIYADYGLHMILNRVDKSMWGSSYEEVYRNGRFIDLGAGFKWGTGSKKYLVSIGYSFKDVEYRRQYAGPPCNTCGESYTTYENFLHRFVMKFGLQF
jgi:hypothetical protein